MSWHYLPELVDQASALSYSDGEQSAPWKSSRTAEKCCCGVSGTVCCRCSLSGMTSGHSRASCGVERWISSLGGSRANHTALPVARKDQKTSGTYGPIRSESFAKWDRKISSWRMYQGYLPLNMPGQFSETLPKAAINLNGILYRRRESAQIMSGNGSGLHVPTPAAVDHKGTGVYKKVRGHQKNLRDWFAYKYNFLYPPVAMVEYLMGWPIGWTDLRPLATDKFRQWLEQHGIY